MISSYSPHILSSSPHLCSDFTERLSLREAVSHAYLTKGTLVMTDEDPSHPHPVELDPTTLHLSEPPVTLPTRASEESGDEGYALGIGTNSAESEDHLWARRQFSILWAPMPASFSSVKEVGHGRVTGEQNTVQFAPFYYDDLNSIAMQPIITNYHVKGFCSIM